METSLSGPAIRVIMMPKDTNALGTIFGGVILSYIDQAAAVQARKYASQRFVTKALNAVEFVSPVHLGDVVSFYTEIVKVGRTSVTVKVDVEAERFDEQERAHTVKVTEATVVCVAIDPGGRPTPILPV
ncbi:MAG TPA: acyl-CoA thioesterase [Terriglobia bacterium]|nr:acyl-CoA thioesterase [Terriglobia bacterium]